jgi:hypothetical protein
VKQKTTDPVEVFGPQPWRVQIYFRWPGSRRAYRERRKVPRAITSESAARRWGNARYAHLLQQGEAATLAERVPEPAPAPEAKPAPTLREFGPRWIEEHAEALQQKRFGIESKRIILRVHLYLALGDLPLDQITTERVAKLSARLAKEEYSRKTVGNVLATLAKLLRMAVEWDVLAAMPCKIKIPKSQRTPPTFYEQDIMWSLIDAAAQIDTRTHALILLGLHAGLRRGEILGLEWRT